MWPENSKYQQMIKICAILPVALTLIGPAIVRGIP